MDKTTEIVLSSRIEDITRDVIALTDDLLRVLHAHGIAVTGDRLSPAMIEVRAAEVEMVLDAISAAVHHHYDRWRLG